jgi:hypothetical protein
MDAPRPTKKRSALEAVPVAIVVEIIAISTNVGGAVTASVAFLVLFGAWHQARLARWRRRAGQHA